MTDNNIRSNDNEHCDNCYWFYHKGQYCEWYDEDRVAWDWCLRFLKTQEPEESEE